MPPSLVSENAEWGVRIFLQAPPDYAVSVETLVAGARTSNETLTPGWEVSESDVDIHLVVT